MSNATLLLLISILIAVGIMYPVVLPFYGVTVAVLIGLLGLIKLWDWVADEPSTAVLTIILVGVTAAAILKGILSW